MRKNIVSCSLFAVLFFMLAVFSTDAALAGTATVSWNAVTTNSDGTPITDLAGYRIYYGTSSRGSAACTTDSHGYTSNVDAGNVLTYTINSGNLVAGQTYYFSVVAYDTSGNKSCFSSEVNKTISDVVITYGLLDFKALMAKWLQIPVTQGVLPDINNDNIVNIRDLGIMLSNWE